MGYCTLELIVDHGVGEGHGRCEGRKAEIGDTGLRIRSVLNQDVALRRDDIGLKSLIPARPGGATDTDNSPLLGLHEQFRTCEGVINL